ncbi:MULTISPECIES: hypothetical protein [Pseudomonas syringae group]|uniref:hypothetical protein n=1 Tax=Pseudomonas syringae group TaxID=136849 RepID=UPI0006A622C7|nr:MULTISPECIES: hypothetical protein [Pseudomonas syringae group]POP73367.1 hypothetical protein CXB37_23235 [Pseudomonas syringae pv. syringae]
MNNYYVIEKKELEPEILNSPEWPKIIGYCHENKSFIFIEGNGHGFNGTVVPETIANEPRWDRLFKILDANWFLKLITSTPRLEKTLLETHIKAKRNIVEIIKS